MNFMDVLSNALRGAFGAEAAIYALAAVGLNLHFGFTGLLNFGHVGFMLVGAYGVAVSVSTWGLSLWVGLLIGIGCSIVLALILGIPTLRLRGDYLAIATIAGAEVLRYFYRSDWAAPITGGVYGLRQFANEFFALNPYSSNLELGPLLFSARNLWVMTVGWSLVVLTSLLVYLLVHSPWGRVLRAVREDELAARSLGKNVYAYKMQSLVLGGVIGGLAGALIAIATQSVNPDNFNPAVTFYLWAIMILGGASRILGPILGSIIFWFLATFLDSFLRNATASGLISPDVISGPDVGALRFVFVGLCLLLLMIYRPAGILGDPKELRLDVR
ncbi:branched-chain amino acid ABC transporter permease [Intrasporangium chromatireducens Q5-1]|uniref:Branched-chain amino acid ABC transporter permease n=1 Tax=Intrasporangium chromatireducens Q5-1 TaxID=584657 RepID=W9GF16_9MICO|nr:branched-chain amino acid ABC transporter permease [Intrasporangium chromatireducens]EWT04635.1 branched-chain amino acid ABC transporter permease [Intrasporangium chromatireducens Q5-1]